MSRETEEPEPVDVLLLAFASVAWIVSVAHFAWLGLRFIPTQTAFLGRIDVTVPLYLRLVDLTAREDRWLPLVVLAAPLVGLVLVPIGIRLMSRRRWQTHAAVRGVAVMALAGTSVTVLLSFAVIQVTQAVYDRVVMEPRFQRR
jgi:hypothetical protein